jgi:hypothetical protein
MNNRNERILGELVKEARFLRAEVNRLKRLEGMRFISWRNWTPTITQSGSVAVTVTRARYCIVERIATVQFKLSVTGSGTAGNGIVIGGQPTEMLSAATEVTIGTALILDAGTAYYQGSVRVVGTNNWQAFAHLEAGAIGADPSFALAAGDVIFFHGSYEVS